ncbi:MAG: hypothetical protein WD534_00520 [Phycisphaeraceae bacterium]
MDSEERHELKENDLAEFFSNFGHWWENYGNVVLLVLVIAAGSFAGYRLYSAWSTEAHEMAFADLAATTTAAGYSDIAEEHRHPTVQALAYLRGGDAAMDQAVRPRETAEAEDTSEEADAAGMSRAQALDRAEAMYRRAQETARQPVFRVNALLGLAQVAETRGQWDQATRYYQQAEEAAAAAELPGLANQARQRHALVERLQQPVVFAPASAAPPMPDMTPSTDFLEGDVDMFDEAEEVETGEAPIPLDPNVPAEPE